MEKMFEKITVLFLLILLLCACGNKSNVSTTNSNDEVLKENASSIDAKYVLEKKVEADGFVWYYFYVRGKKKGGLLMKGAMNENKEKLNF